MREQKYVFPCPHCNGMIETATDGHYLKAVKKHKEDQP